MLSAVFFIRVRLSLFGGTDVRSKGSWPLRDMGPSTISQRATPDPPATSFATHLQMGSSIAKMPSFGTENDC